MWVCLKCHDFNDSSKEKCGKCEMPRQQKEKPKGKHEHKNANFLSHRKTMYTRGNAKGWQKANQAGYERQSVVRRVEGTSLVPAIQAEYQRKSAVGRLESTSSPPTIQPDKKRVLLEDSKQHTVPTFNKEMTKDCWLNTAGIIFSWKENRLE
ncbi:Hypothetical predicted protein [Mytilus galloprovincialis]|uniref:RanBP2-type domain-containing protein n=1 Tax=Mytilus galloprovincialis TaxID=29158 RepID=A0A8B6HTQ8_MYTGA|nr:Hypothetical predicted protein [Mytilus galloprovincialis]